MVAFATEYAPKNEAPDAQNRARGIFLAAELRAGENGARSRYPRREKAGSSYETASGPTVWLNRDPLGYAAGVNLYGYVLGDPINRWDPLGLDWLDAAADFTAGWGDTLSFGVTRGIRSGMDWFGGKVTDQWASDSAVVDRCSDAYGAGQLTGTVHGFALGGAGYARGISTFRSQGTRTKLYEIGQRTFSNRQHGYYTQRNANIVKKGIDIARAEGARGAALPGFGSAPYFTKTIWTGLTPLARQEFGRTVVPTAYGFGVGAYGTNSLYFGNSDCQ